MKKIIIGIVLIGILTHIVMHQCGDCVPCTCERCIQERQKMHMNVVETHMYTLIA